MSPLDFNPYEAPRETPDQKVAARRISILRKAARMPFFGLLWSSLCVLILANWLILIDNFHVWRAGWAMAVACLYLILPLTHFVEPTIPRSTLWGRCGVVATLMVILAAFEIFCR